MFKKALFSRVISLSFTVTFSVFIYANTYSSEITSSSTEISAPDKVNDVEILSVKQELMKKIEQLSSFKAEFSQKIFDADGKAIQTNAGSLAVSKPNLLHWQISEPNESLIVSDGKALWLYDPFIEQVSVYSVTDAIINTPILLLSNPSKIIWRDYEVERIAKNRYLIKSKNNDSQVKSLELSFSNNASTQLEEFVILDATGQLSRVKLTNVTKLSTKENDLFRFTVPEGVEIDDQR